MINPIQPSQPSQRIGDGAPTGQDPSLTAYELMAEIYLLEKSPNVNDPAVQTQINNLLFQLNINILPQLPPNSVVRLDVEQLPIGSAAILSYFENPAKNPILDAFDYINQINLNPNNLDPAGGFGLMMLLEAAYTNPSTSKYQSLMETLLEQGGFGQGGDFLSKFFLEEGAKLGFSPQVILDMMHQPNSNDGPNYTNFYSKLSNLVSANWAPTSPNELQGDWMALQAYIDNALGVPPGPASPQPSAKMLAAAPNAGNISAEVQQLMQLIEDLTNNKPGAEQNLINFLQTLIQNGDITNPTIAALLNNINLQQAIYQAYMHGAESAYFNGYKGLIGEAAYQAYINDQMAQLQKLGAASGPIIDDMQQALASIQAEADDYNSEHCKTVNGDTIYYYTYTNADGSQSVYEYDATKNQYSYYSTDASGNIEVPPTTVSAAEFQGFVTSHIVISGIAGSDASYWNWTQSQVSKFAYACLQQMSNISGSFTSYFINFFLNYYKMEEGSQAGYQAQLDQIAALLQDVNKIMGEINQGATITAAQALQLASDLDKLKTFIDSANFLSPAQKQQFEQAIDQDFWGLNVNGKTLEQWLQADPTGGQLAKAIQAAVAQPGGLTQLTALMQQLSALSQEQNIVANQLQLVMDMMKAILQLLNTFNQQNQQIANKAQQIPS